MNIIIIPLSIASLLLVSCKPAKEQAKSSEPAATATEAASTPAATPAAIPYPLETCLVSGEKLGSMGTPPEIIHEGRQIKFCCKSCIPDFKEDPAKYLSKLK